MKKRRRYYSINGQKSEIRDVRCGFPQGSFLGPLLFIVILNDCEGCLDYSKLACTQMTHTHNSSAINIDDLISIAIEELSTISDWLIVSKLSPNPSKYMRGY